MPQTVRELFDFSNKNAIVTGGALGIGQGIAFRLAEAGANVLVADINLEAANETVKEIEKRGGKAKAAMADAGNVADAKKVARATLDTFGGIDILVNNAGIYPFMRVMDTSEQVWDKVLDVNLKGLFFYSQAAAAEMIKAKKGGKIVNIASMSGIHPSGLAAFYDASKAGVIQVTKSLALELARYQITVNAIAPGTIITPGMQTTAAVVTSEATLKRIPLRRSGEPDDIAKAVLFLASPASDYITGTLLLVDGGYLLT